MQLLQQIERKQKLPRLNVYSNALVKRPKRNKMREAYEISLALN